jgi:hypothetical protein
LARSTDSWPNQKWLLFLCGSCQSPVYLEVSDGHVDAGELDGGPGPSLIVSQRLEVPGLRVKVGARGITVTFRNLHRRVAARE